MSAVCAAWLHPTASYSGHVVWMAKKVLFFVLNATLQGQLQIDIISHHLKHPLANTVTQIQFSQQDALP